MALPLIAGLASGLANIGGGMLAQRSHNKYADFLDEQKVKMPDAIGSAEAEFRGMASKGLPGKETIADDIQSQIARTMGLGKQVAESPSQLLDLLSKSHEGASSGIRELGVQDATAKDRNRHMLADFLARAKAPMEMNVANQNLNLKVSAEKERMMGTSELLQGITGGMTGFMTGASNQMVSDHLKSQNEILNNFFSVDDFLGEDSADKPFTTNDNDSFKSSYGKWLFEQNTLNRFK
jgi:hypothetical protein